MDLEYLVSYLQYPLRSYLRNPSHIAQNILWRWRSGRSEEQHVFVVGAPRSGTTLLQVLVASHSRFCTWEGETRMFTWQNTFATNANHLGLDRSFVEREFGRQTNLVDFFDACVEQFRGTQSKERFVEKTPQHIHQTRFLVNHFPDSDIVHIHRDGRDCYCSARRAGIPRGGDLERFALYWKKCIQSRRAVSADQIIDVSYKSLTERPEETVRQLMGALGEEIEEQQLDPRHRSKDQRADTPRFRKLGRSINTSSQDRWKEEMSREEVRQFEGIAGDQLDAFGYDLLT